MAISLNISVRAFNLELDRPIEQLEEQLAYYIVEESRSEIDESTPRGRLYRRGRFKSGESRGLNTGRRRRARGPGMRFHRASAPGQAPAEDTGKTYADIRVSRLKKGTYRIRFGGAAGYLEFGTSRMAARPFVIKGIERAVRRVFDGSSI